MNVRIKSPNLAALRAAVFTLSAKNLRGGGAHRAPPPGIGLRITFNVNMGSFSPKLLRFGQAKTDKGTIHLG